MFKITHGLLESPWSPPSLIQPAKGYAAGTLIPTSRDVVPAVANTLSAFGLSRFGKKTLAEIANASLVKSHKTHLGAKCKSLFLKVSI